jgi:hypothetical protein
MGKAIEIVSNDIIIEAILNDTKTAKNLLKILPIKSEANLWGSEIYFEIPMDADLENGKELMEIGNIAFWPQGNAFCIFFGPTPAGDGTQPRAISPVTVIGKINGNNWMDKIKKIKSGDLIEVRVKK